MIKRDNLAKNRNYHPGLDLLRFSFAVLVVAEHAFAYRFLALGGPAVAGFFALSGFLITSLLLEEETKKGQVDLKAFFVRRLLRIWPAYFFLLIAAMLFRYILLSIQTPFSTPLGPILTEYTMPFVHIFTFTMNLLSTDSMRGPLGLGYLWTLSIEEQFYLVWPPLFLLLRTPVLRMFALILTIAVFSGLSGYVLPRFVPVMTGCLMAILFNTVPAFKSIARTFISRIVFLSLFFGLILLGMNFYSVAGGVVSSGLVGSFSGVAGFQKSPIRFDYVGKLSYPMYLFHPWCIKVANWVVLKAKVDSIIFIFSMSLALSIMVAGVSWELLEKRVLNFKHQASQSKPFRWIAVLLVFGNLCVGLFYFLTIHQSSGYSGIRTGQESSE